MWQASKVKVRSLSDNTVNIQQISQAFGILRNQILLQHWIACTSGWGPWDKTHLRVTNMFVRFWNFFCVCG